MNRLLKFPRPNRAAGNAGYILGRPTRDIEADTIDGDDDAISVAAYSTGYGAGTSAYEHGPTTDSRCDDGDGGGDDDDIDIESANRYKPSTRRRTYTSQSKTITSNIGLSKMTTRYRFRDLLLGDFSFNDDGERYVHIQFILFALFVHNTSQKIEMKSSMIGTCAFNTERSTLKICQSTS